MLRVALVFAALCAMVALTGAVRGAIDQRGGDAIGPAPATAAAPAHRPDEASDE